MTHSARLLTILSTAAIAACALDPDDLPDESSVAQGVGSGGGSGGTYTPPPSICVVDNLKLAEGSKIVAGGKGSTQLEVGRDPTIHEAVTLGLVDFKGPFIYHPEKLLRFTCAPTTTNTCEAKVATSTLTYDTGPQNQGGLPNPNLWVHPSINVTRNARPIVMSTASGYQYSVDHFHPPQVDRAFRNEPTYLEGRAATSAAISTASRIQQILYVDLALHFGWFKLELPEIGWREAHHTNSAGAIVSCGWSQPCTPDVTVTVANNSDKQLVVSNCTGTYTIDPNQTMTVNAKRNDSLRGAHAGSSVYGIMPDPQNGKSYACRYEATPYQGNYMQQRTICQ